MDNSNIEEIIENVHFDFHFTWGDSDTQPTNRHFQEIKVRYNSKTGKVLEVLEDLNVQPKTADPFEYVQSMASFLDYHPGLGQNLPESKRNPEVYRLEDDTLFVSKELLNKALVNYDGQLFRVSNRAIRITWNGIEECPYELDNSNISR